MRVVIGILLLTVSIAPAAAQYAAPAPAAATPVPATPAPTPPAAKTASAPAAPVYPSGTADFHVNGGDVIAAPPPRSPQQREADQESQAAWQARCRPAVIESPDGIRRVRYAAVDCDLSRFNTAGGK
jgi:hypothetical protein